MRTRFSGGSAGGVGDPVVERRIQRKHLFRSKLGKLGRDVQVDLPGDVDLHEVRLVRDRRELQAVRRRIVDDAAHREQLRHVRARFARQLQAEEIGRLARRAILLDRARDVRFAAVVRRDREQPVAIELFRQELQIVERCGRSRDDVASPVVVPVLLQVVASTGTRNELPQTGGSCARVGDGVERALDDRQQRELERHVARLDLVDDVVQVALAAPEGAVEISGMLREPAHLALDRRVIDVLECEAAANALEQVAGGRRGGDAADAAHQRRAGLGLGIEGLDRVFDLLRARDTDLGLVQLDDCGIELDRLERLLVLRVAFFFGNGRERAATGSDDGGGCKNCIQPCPGAPRFDH
jgi:hypothetical protein